MNRDELRGKAKAVKGKVKKAVGNLTGDDALRDEGAVDEVAGNTRQTLGRARRKVGDAVKHLGNAIKK